MRIVYKDGGVLECYRLELTELCAYADEIYTIPYDEIDYVEDSDEED